jgi:hypothetical protein
VLATLLVLGAAAAARRAAGRLGQTSAGSEEP